MISRSDALELLSPAKNADFGIEAIDHGADAVYIGGPLFGARSGAGNSVADIERLARHAHRFNARVLVALNTILRDDELEAASRLVRQVYEAGADALIVQDMGLLELDLPPIQLHASTQCDTRTPEKAHFLENVGFSQIVLARELSLEQIAEISRQTTATLEFFVHGALCVSYSGQCYLSCAHTGRSANRGDCAQMCRLPYSLLEPQGRLIAANSHLLSLKDNDQTNNLQALIEAGIRSFKIEGRLKDLAYVKNVTAHYRRQLDAILEASPQYCRASSGRCVFSFMPDPGKTFNRGATDYFVHQRQADIGAFATPKFTGEKIGIVRTLARDSFEITPDNPVLALNNGDGLTYFDTKGELAGLRVNSAERTKTGFRLFFSLSNGKPPPGLRAGTALYRNHDQEFCRLLEKKSAERRIPLRLQFAETPEGFSLRLEDDRGISADAHLAYAKEMGRDGERVLAAFRENLGKLGNTIYTAESIELSMSEPWFVPASLINALRREAAENLDKAREAARQRPERHPPAEPPPRYPEHALTYLGNVYNRKAREFYEKHGVELIELAFECGRENVTSTGEIPLMVTKHCLRFSFNLCPKQVKGIRPDPLALVRGNDRLTLQFDCKRCEMLVMGRADKKAFATGGEPNEH